MTLTARSDKKMGVIAYMALMLVAAIIIAAFIEFAKRQALKKGITKKCPHCRETIDGAATVCRYCSRDLL